MLTVNADDLGRTKTATDRILDCWAQRRVHATSAMVLMQDSGRAADLAQRAGIDVGLHLNLAEPFSGANVTEVVRESQNAVSRYLRSRKTHVVLAHPLLRNDFERVYRVQWDEYTRLYGHEPGRIDGHHHMHLCANMLSSGLLPAGIRLRRNFTFDVGEKSLPNRLYRWLVDSWLRSRFEVTDRFYSVVPMDEERLSGIVTLSEHADIELMVHPAIDEEYRFLLSERWARLIAA